MTQFGLELADHAWREPRTHEATDPCVTRIVHHVEHLTGDGEILEHGAAVGSIATCLGGIGVGVVQDGEDLVVGRNRPETFAIGRVLGGFVPMDKKN